MTSPDRPHAHPAVRAVVVLAALGIALGLSSCSTRYDYAEPEIVEPAPEVEPVEQVPDAAPPPVAPVASSWICSWDPTMNDNWHDDALCSNGVETIRPSLREWDDFVTHDELMDDAAAYAATLNG